LDMMAFSLGFPVPTVARIALACHPGRAPQDWANKQKVTRKKKRPIAQPQWTV